MRTFLSTAVALVILLSPPMLRAEQCPHSRMGRDTCQDAWWLDSQPGQYVYLFDASQASSVWPETVCGNDAGYTVWFRLMSTETGLVTVSTCHPYTSYDTVVEVLRGPSCASLVSEVCTDDTVRPGCDNGCSGYGSDVEFMADEGENYWIVIGAKDDNVAGCVLCLGLVISIGETCGDPPSNLLCEWARELPGTLGSCEVGLDLTGAEFISGAEPDPQCGPGHAFHTVWFEVTPSTDAYLDLSTCHPNTLFDPLIQVWTGECGGVLTSVACNDDAPEWYDWGYSCILPCEGQRYLDYVGLSVDAGVTYYIQVGSVLENFGGGGCRPCLGLHMTLREPAGLHAAEPPRTGAFLRRIHPNPSPGRTTLTFELASRAHVDLRLVNALGRQVATLMARELPAGVHACAWDGEGPRGRTVPAGVYWVVLSVGGQQAEQRLMVLR